MSRQQRVNLPTEIRCMIVVSLVALWCYTKDVQVVQFPDWSVISAQSRDT